MFFSHSYSFLTWLYANRNVDVELHWGVYSSVLHKQVLVLCQHTHTHTHSLLSYSEMRSFRQCMTLSVSNQQKQYKPLYNIVLISGLLFIIYKAWTNYLSTINKPISFNLILSKCAFRKLNKYCTKCLCSRSHCPTRFDIFCVSLMLIQTFTVTFALTS